MDQSGPKPDVQRMPGREDLQRRIRKRIKHFERASTTGLWSIVIFLLASFCAYDNFSFLPDMSTELRQLLGPPPPESMISLALVIYAFSGIVQNLARMSQNIKPYKGFVHAAFFIAFYIFYHLSGYLPDNFWAVFFAGLSVMGLENYYLWAHSHDAVKKEKELLKSMSGGEN